MHENKDESLLLDEPVNGVINEPKFTNEHKLGMIRSVLKYKMDNQQLVAAMREIKDIIES